MNKNIIPVNLQKVFILGGNSKIILTNPITENFLIFRIKISKDNNNLFFVSFKNGSGFYEYLGIINNEVFKITVNSKFKADSPQVKGFSFIWDKIISNKEITEVIISHDKKCPVCNKALLTDKNIEIGFHEYCFKKVTGFAFNKYTSISD